MSSRKLSDKAAVPITLSARKGSGRNAVIFTPYQIDWKEISHNPPSAHKNKQFFNNMKD